MKKILNWLDNNLLAILAGFLLVFIPLYPKWPLFDIIYGYNVRVRLEDFFVAATLLVYVVQLLRRKISLSFNPVTIGIFAYLAIGLLSVFDSVFIIKTVPLEYIHAGKTFLHWLRRVEYFSLFFILFNSVKSIRTVKIYVWLFFMTLLVVILYGFGQKYLYWPAFSTMNREFSKGWWLYLTEHARVLSTFGGHYDLAGYLVIALTLCWSFFFGLKNQIRKVLVGLLLAGAFWLLILTASRISFIAYLLGLSIVVFLWTYQKGLRWGISRWLVATFLSILVMLSFGDLSDRFLRLTRVSQTVSSLRNVLLKPAAPPPASKAVFLENNLAAVTSKSDKPPSPYPPGSPPQPAEVTGNELPLLIPQKTASGSTILVPTKRTYSQNAVLFDLSTGIRLDATWPRAWAGFWREPVLGSGYATLTKTTIEEFTEGESTDSDYFRALGETGLLGFLSFFGTIFLMILLVFRALGGIKDPSLYALCAGFIGLCLGLLVNGSLIDIFEASKVAYTFWAVSGFTLGAIYLNKSKIAADRQPLRIAFSWPDFTSRLKKFFSSDLFWVGTVALLALTLRTYKLSTPLADWHSWRQADTSAVTRNFIKFDSINWLYPTYDDLSSVASSKPNPMGYRFVEFPIYNAVTVVVKKVIPELSVEAAGRATTALASTLSVIFLFLICRSLLSRRIAYFAALSLTLLPYSIYYGRSILPDPTMVALSLGALWFGLSKRTFFSLIFAAAAMLVKPYAIFLLAPLIYFDKKYLFYLAVAATPFGLWRWWISHYPEGIPASSWLLNGDGIRFKGAFWYWLFADRIGRLILGYWGLLLAGFGLIRKTNGKYHLFPILFLLSSLLYLFVFATGNVRHDYYQILIIPAISIFVALGLDFLLSYHWRGRLLGLISVLFMLGFGWYFARDYYNINHPEIVEAGKEVEKISDWRALVVAPYDGDTAFLYQTNRRGWPLVEKSIDYLVSLGADYYVSVRFDDLTKSLISNKNYKVLKLTDKYVIIQLVPDKDLPR